MSIKNRYEFVYFFDVTNGNPNGDPDAGNMPRLDPGSSRGLVTDVCLKRKIRNFIEVSNENEPGYEIYVKDGSVLNLQHQKAYDALGLNPKDKEKTEIEKVKQWMCNNFFDIRTFGAVMSTDVNCGVVRGPVQFSFAQSIDPIIPMDITITRMAITKKEDEKKEKTMGRKHIVPYALYRMHGFISANLADKTGFSHEDLDKLWNSLLLMFDHDRSAARGDMSARKLIIFKHENNLGSEPANKLFDSVKVTRVNGKEGTPATGYSDYDIFVPEKNSISGIEIIEKL